MTARTRRTTRLPAKSKRNIPAEIVLTVTRFKDVLTTSAADRGTHHTMHVDPPDHPVISMKPLPSAARQRQHSGNSGTLKIKREGTTLRFRIESAEENGVKHVYFPIGIAFQERAGSTSGDPVARDDFQFSSVRLKGQRLEIFDNFSRRCTCERPRYKFSVIIQREKDAQIGIIDPGIEHER